MKYKFFVYMMTIVMIISMLSIMPVANASSVVSTVFDNGAYGSGYDWLTDRVEILDNGKLKLSTGNYYQQGYIKANEFLPVTADTRDQYALKFKIYDAKMAGVSAMYNIFLVGDYFRTSDNKYIPMYIQPNDGWQTFTKDSGKDYKEVVIPLSEFRNVGRVGYPNNSTAAADPESADANFKLIEVDWSRIHVGVSLMGVNYGVGKENYGVYLHYGYIVIDDVEFVKIFEPGVKAYAVDENENLVGTESPLTVPANVGIMAEFDSEFQQSDTQIMTKFEIIGKDGNVGSSVKKSDSRKNSFVIKANDNLVPGESYSLVIKDGLVDIAGKELGEKSIEFIAANPIVYLPDPVSPEVLETTRDSVTLGWDAPVWEDGDIEGYKIYRDGVEVFTTSSTSFTDTDLVPDTTYSYKIVSYSGEYLSKSETAVVAETDEYEAPSGFVTEYIGSNELWLGWDNVEDALGYVLNIDGKDIELTDNKYLITNIEPNTAMSLKLKAKNKNASDTVYYSSIAQLDITTKNTAESPIHTLVAYGKLGDGVTNSDWGKPEYGFPGKAGIDGESSYMSIYAIGGGGCGVNFNNDKAIPLSAGTGVWMYVKTEDGRPATSMKLAVKGNSTEPSVAFDVKSAEWTPIYIPFSEYTRLGLNVTSSKYLYFVGNGSGDHYFALDGMMVAANAPEVTDVYLSDDGIEKNSPYPETATELNVRFSAPIDEKSLANIEVYINDEKQEDVSFVYKKAKLTATAKFTKNWPEEAEIRVVVPTTVKAVDHYTIEGETGAVSSTTLTTGAALKAEFEKTLSIRENPVRISAETAKNNGTANGAATISNISDADVSVVVYTVVYNKTAEGVIRYKGLVSKAAEVEAGETNVYVETPEITYASGDTVETYVWNDDMISVVNR